MHDHGESDGPIVLTKPSNNSGQPAAETVEGRGPAKGNTTSKTGAGLRAGQRTSNALDGVRCIAATDKDAKFTALMHHININRLRLAYKAMNPKAAVGVDETYWADYGEALEDNLRDLHARVQSGAYRAKPVRRVHIPKADGKLRPLGIAALEDKIVQKACVEVLNAIYECDFAGFSYGFREGRSPHDALDALAVGIYKKKVNWVLDADIAAYFDSIDKVELVKFLEHRIADKRMLRLIQKWLNAGVIENGEWSKTEHGTPQGATVSPLLANVYLHYVFDQWASRWRKRNARGDMIIVRFADDYIVGFQHEDDARQFIEELRQRLGGFNLKLAADKTRLVEFGRFAARDRKAKGLSAPETFDFLGFTHICTKTRQGKFMIRRHTSKKKMRAKLRNVKDELKQRRHRSIPEQGKWLAAVVRGHANYYAVPGNLFMVNAFHHHVIDLWHRSLKRRSQRQRLDWKRMRYLAERWVPLIIRKQPFPEQRFNARYT